MQIRRAVGKKTGAQGRFKDLVRKYAEKEKRKYMAQIVPSGKKGGKYQTVTLPNRAAASVHERL